jgi:hypothetical protein
MAGNLRGPAPWRASRIAALAAIVLLVAIVAVWALWPGGDDEPANVEVREGDVLVARVTRSEALDMAAARIGFQPVVADELPVNGLALDSVTTIVPPEADAEAPRSLLYFVPPETEGQPESLVILAQSTVYWGVPLDDARSIDLEADGAEAWALSPEGEQGGEYWLHAGDMYVYALLGAPKPISDSDAAEMLHSLARELQ